MSAPQTEAAGCEPAEPVVSRRSNAMVIAAILAGLLAGFVLEPVVWRRETAVALWGFRLPTTCSFRRATGLPCASCGLTRSVVMLLHGRARDAWAAHPFGVPTLALILLALPPRVAGVLGRRPRWAVRWDRVWGWSAAAALLLMLVWWGARMVSVLRGGGS